MKVKEKSNKFPFIGGYGNEHEWYRALFPLNDTEHNVETIEDFKYGDLLYNGPTNEDTYNALYKAFIHEIDGVMERLYKLSLEQFEPYDNVTEYTKEETTHGVTETINKYGEQNGEGENYQTPQNTSTQYKTGRTTQKSNEHTDNVKTLEHIDTLEITRHGNIGVTSNATLGNEFLDYVTKLKFIDLFLYEYNNMFTSGVWGV